VLEKAFWPGFKGKLELAKEFAAGNGLAEANVLARNVVEGKKFAFWASEAWKKVLGRRTGEEEEMTLSSSVKDTY